MLFVTDLQLTDDELKNYTLIEIENILQSNGRSLLEFLSMPYPDMMQGQIASNKLIHDELNYDRTMLKEEYMQLMNQLNEDQMHIYNVVSNAVKSNRGGVFFVCGHGGIEETFFLWKTLSTYFRSESTIVLNVTSSGIASLLLLGGKPAHFRFRIPMQIIEDSTCNIQ